MSVTAKEIAKELNISAAAVSMALNNKPGVSTKTRKIIFEKAREMGYDFSKLTPAEEIITPKGTIYFVIYRKHGAVIPNNVSGGVNDVPFFAQLSEGISAGCKQRHYFMNVSYMYEDDDIYELFLEINIVNKSDITVENTVSNRSVFPFPLKIVIVFCLHNPVALTENGLTVFVFLLTELLGIQYVLK